ncbi:MAG: phosphotransferase family protein, partial [Actinomycetota bacterium]
MLSELHAYPVADAADRLGAPPADVAWQPHYEQLWPLVSEVALPELDHELADAVTRRFMEMVEHPPVFPTGLIHNDLGPVHVLIGSDGPAGIIDFEDAWLGDPATDLTPLVACLGRAALLDLAAGRDLGERLDDRLVFYRWMGSIHAIVYGVREGVAEERIGGVDELPTRGGSHHQ